MKHYLRLLAPVLVSVLFVSAGIPWLNAQIIEAIRAHVDHSFIIGDTTLPPGDYTFRMAQDSDLAVMTATSENDKTNVGFVVRETIADHTPTHSELAFRKYGNTEFLSKIFERGSKSGVEVTETSRQEARLAKQMQHATEHTEEQK
ncbi:MAG TPA: hypothetical protein VGS05_18090 [Candidatus Sulfotelmatobacter sp.]|nr:hypothetical protein [Candidatus Sulfotelmatobacter sp.]